MRIENISYENQLQDMQNRNKEFDNKISEHEEFFLKLDRQNVIQGFIFSEILGKPKAKRKRR